MKRRGLNHFKGMRKPRFDLNDALILIGWLGALAGIWLIYQPAAYIAAGISLVCLGLIGGSSTRDE
jgi:hypothetical protein